MSETINIEGLQNVAKQYQSGLISLPFLTFNEISKNLKIRIVEVQGEQILVNKRRKAGMLAPYAPGTKLGKEKEIMKFLEMKLKPERTFADLRDNVTNYDDIKIISNAGNFVNNKTKKHPLEYEIVKDVIISHGEDVGDSMFFAERDTSVKSPLTAFTGFFPKIDLLVAEGLISAGEKNLITTGEILMPTDATSTDAYDQVVDFIAKAHPLLRKGVVYLYMTEGTLIKARAGYKNKVKAHTDPTTKEMLERLKDDALCPKLEVLTDPSLGTGDKMMLMAPNMLDFGVGSISDDKFCQVRPIGDDPNDVQFWIQASYDTRINDVHPKVFQTNELSNKAPQLAGDYR